ncbi:MAG: hypothetical protein AAGC83_13250, partial [Pseudomonadota bacterium]
RRPSRRREVINHIATYQGKRGQVGVNLTGENRRQNTRPRKVLQNLRKLTTAVPTHGRSIKGEGNGKLDRQW